MARKRIIRIAKEEVEKRVEENDIPEKYRDLGWGHWLRNSYAKAWYLLLCAFLDTIIPLEIHRLFPQYSAALPLLSLLVLIPLQAYIYWRLWNGLDFIFGR